MFVFVRQADPLPPLFPFPYLHVQYVVGFRKCGARKGPHFGRTTLHHIISAARKETSSNSKAMKGWATIYKNQEREALKSNNGEEGEKQPDFRCCCHPRLSETRPARPSSHQAGCECPRRRCRGWKVEQSFDRRVQLGLHWGWTHYLAAYASACLGLEKQAAAIQPQTGWHCHPRCRGQAHPRHRQRRCWGRC